MLNNVKLIIVPVDGSESSGRAAAFAADLARVTDLPVRLLHVYAPTGNELVGMAQLPRERIEAFSAESGRAAFEQARSEMNTDGIQVDELVVWGEPREEIIAAANAEAGMIVMGRRGLGRMKEILLGSVSDAVMRNAGRPVTIIS